MAAAERHPKNSCDGKLAADLPERYSDELLVVDLSEEDREYEHKPGRPFRVIPSQMSSVENNLSLANMDFKDFADSVDQDGVFRGFPEA